MPASCLARPLATLAILLAATGLAGGCESRSRELQAGSYRAVLELPGGELPFGLDVTKEGDRNVLFLVNGEERLRVDEVAVSEGQLTATLPGAGSTLKARIAGKRLDGEVVLQRRGGEREALEFSAELGQAWRFFETPGSDNADVSGRWAVALVGAQGAQGTTIAEFEQSFERVTGTLSAPADGVGVLAGEVRGDELHLSRFDGSSATLLWARVAEDGALVGEYWSGTSRHQRFRAVRLPSG